MNPLPWLSSPVAVTTVVSIISQLLVLLGKQDVVPIDLLTSVVENILQAIALLFTGWTLIARWRSKLQPLALSKKSASARSNVVSSHWLVSLLVLTAMLFTIAGCAGHRAFWTKQTPTTDVGYLKKMLVQHNAVGNEIARIQADATASTVFKSKVSDFYRRTVCSKAEIAAPTLIVNCRQGPAYTADTAVRAYEAVENAQTEADVEAAAAELVPLLTSLFDLIYGDR